MAGRSDKIKGRVKEAVGVLMNDKRLEREGKVDQVFGDVKEGVEEVVHPQGCSERTQEVGAEMELECCMLRRRPLGQLHLVRGGLAN